MGGRKGEEGEEEGKGLRVDEMKRGKLRLSRANERKIPVDPQRREKGVCLRAREPCCSRRGGRPEEGGEEREERWQRPSSDWGVVLRATRELCR